MNRTSAAQRGRYLRGRKERPLIKSRVLIAAGVAAITLVAIAAAGVTSPSRAAVSAENPSKAVAAAQANIKKLSNLRNIKFPMPTQPINVGEQRKVFILTCGLVGGCLLHGRFVEQAFKQMGWQTSPLFDGKFLPATMSAGINQAVQQGYDGIVLISIDTRTIAAALRNALSKGVKIVCGMCGATPGFPQIANIGLSGVNQGEAIGDYIIQATRCKGNVVILNDSGFIVVTNRVAGVKKRLAACGSSMKVSQVNMSAAELGQPGPPTFKAVIQKYAKGSLTWVVPPYDAGVSSMLNTLKQTGRTEVRLNGFDGNPDVVQLVGAGAVPVGTSWPGEFVGWADADVLARKILGKPVWNSANLPTAVFLKKNYKQFLEGGFSPPGVNFKAQFKRLWRK